MRTTILIALALLAVPGCGQSGSPADAPPPATLGLEQVTDMTGGLYVEGSLGYVRLEDADGGKVFEEQLDPDRPESTHDVPAGDYVLKSWQRPCDGNCGYLDPPTDECQSALALPSGEHVRVTITLRPGHGCSIDAS